MKRHVLFPILLLIIAISFARQIGNFLTTSANTFYPLPERARYVTPVGNDRVYFVKENKLHFNDCRSSYEVEMDVAFGQIVGATEDYLYFSATSKTFGEELYRHSANQIKFVKDLTAGKTGTVFQYNASATLENALFFVAEDTRYGKELWVTDGQQTRRITDIAPGKANTLPGSLTAVEGEIYFSASDGNSRELYKTDGYQLTKIQNHDNSGYHYVRPASMELVKYSGDIYFTASDSTGDNEIWKFDGEVVSKAIEINTHGSSEPEELTVFKDKLLFRADHPTKGIELFEYDGNDVQLLSAKNTAFDYTKSQVFIVSSNYIYFKAYSDSNKEELWSYDGKEIAMITQFPTELEIE
ncbi:MAG: hypothetical protein AAF551_02135 [Bacteroidota bacterium]